MGTLENSGAETGRGGSSSPTFPDFKREGYRPYRMSVVRKNITQEKGENVLFHVRYFFSLTNEQADQATPTLAYEVLS